MNVAAASLQDRDLNVTLTVHRSADQVGGNCIEIAGGGDRIILDVRRPLDAPNDAIDRLPDSLDRSRPAHVLISHPHQYHYGLLDEVPASWPIYSGAATEKLIRLTASITGKNVDRPFLTWRSGERCGLGPSGSLRF